MSPLSRKRDTLDSRLYRGNPAPLPVLFYSDDRVILKSKLYTSVGLNEKQRSSRVICTL